jgi:hypothetical protein
MWYIISIEFLRESPSAVTLFCKKNLDRLKGITSVVPFIVPVEKVGFFVA